MSKVYFPTVNKIAYEGPQSTNPFAFKYYNPDEIVLGKPMKEHLRFSMAYWHTFTYMGNDPFGGASFTREWDGGDPMTQAKERVHAAFEFTHPSTIGRAISSEKHPEHFGCAHRIISELQLPKSAVGINCLFRP